MGMIGNAPAAGILSGANIQDGSIQTADLADGAITAAKMASTAVTDKLGYTPVNKAGDVMTGGLRTYSGSSTSTAYISGGSTYAPTFANTLKANVAAGDSNRAVLIQGDANSVSTWFAKSDGTAWNALDADDSGLGFWSNSSLVGWQRGARLLRSNTDTKVNGVFITPLNTAFNVRAQSAKTDTAAGWHKITYNNSLSQRGTSFDTSTSRFTAPVDGWYQFNAQVSCEESGDSDGTFCFAKNGAVNSNFGTVSMSQTGTLDGHSVSACTYLAATDYVEVYLYSTPTSVTYRQADWQGSFSGHLIG